MSVIIGLNISAYLKKIMIKISRSEKKNQENHQEESK